MMAINLCLIIHLYKLLALKNIFIKKLLKIKKRYFLLKYPTLYYYNNYYNKNQILFHFLNLSVNCRDRFSAVSRLGSFSALLGALWLIAGIAEIVSRRFAVVKHREKEIPVFLYYANAKSVNRRIFFISHNHY